RGAARERSIQRALTGEKDFRMNVVREGDSSFRRISDFRDIDATLPFMRLKDPTTRIGRIEIARASMRATPFRPPSVDVVDASGALEFNADSVWWHGVRARLPNSTVAGSGFYGFQTNALGLELRGDPVALADVRWVVPRLPERGTATLDLSVRWTDTTET